jgi:dihydropteroate synthase
LYFSTWPFYFFGGVSFLDEFPKPQPPSASRLHLESWLAASERRPLIMGILNVTPDSFSDGGRFADAPSAAACGLEMLAAGADILDIGGESTRPGSASVLETEQIRRVAPVIRLIRQNSAAPISVDTTRWEVAAAAIAAGANMVNDVSAGRDDPAMLAGAARAAVPARRAADHAGRSQIRRRDRRSDSIPHGAH